jgi:hypothetical protein
MEVARCAAILLLMCGSALAGVLGYIATMFLGSSYSVGSISFVGRGLVVGIPANQRYPVYAASDAALPGLTGFSTTDFTWKGFYLGLL